MREVDVNTGLSPHHYAGMVFKPDPKALSRQSQKVLFIGTYLKKEEVGDSNQPLEEDPDYLTPVSIKNRDDLLKNFPNEGQPLYEMISKALATGYTDLYAFAIDDSVTNLEGIVDLLPDEQFTQIVSSIDEGLAKFDEELEKRWNATNQIDGHLFIAKKGSLDELKTAYGGKGELKHVTILSTSDSDTEPYIWASVLAATVAKYANKPYLPFYSLPLVGLSAPTTKPKLEDRNALLQEGFSTFYCEGKKVFVDRLVTRHKKDPSYRDLNKKMILSYLRYDFVQALKQAYPRAAISNDETQASDEVMTPNSGKTLAVARHQRWKEEKYVQDPGREFAKNLKAWVDPNNGETMRFYLPVKLMGQLQTTVTTIAFTP